MPGRLPRHDDPLNPGATPADSANRQQEGINASRPQPTTSMVVTLSAVAAPTPTGTDTAIKQSGHPSIARRALISPGRAPTSIHRTLPSPQRVHKVFSCGWSRVSLPRRFRASNDRAHGAHGLLPRGAAAASPPGNFYRPRSRSSAMTESRSCWCAAPMTDTGNCPGRGQRHRGNLGQRARAPAGGGYAERRCMNVRQLAVGPSC